ncbi:unnamed protein product [Ilex paraguariensis]|uniref:Uncharacterized protein n=1 Tax=Ilex paraguariensis TaxID=185542 RepID=A0ABC8TZV3_9AQUA
MSTERQGVTVRDLVEEAKKRIVFLIICVVGLSYLMSLTSSSVLVNLPAAAFLIVILRYLSLDFDMRRKVAAYQSKPSSASLSSQRKPLEGPKVVIDKSDWRRKVNSPVVEDAIDQFSRHLISEWVTDLWYSRITPDRQVPEELVQIINGVLGEVSCHVRNINLIDLLTRDIVHLLCTHLELFRASQAKIEKQWSRLLTIERRDMELKSVLATDNKLHPALFSTESEHKVLQHLMDGLISVTFKPEDMQCSLFRYIVRELLACAVMRPVLNLASPRFINERIESLVMSSLDKADKGATTSHSKPNGSSKMSTDRFTRFLDPSAKGVELVQLKKDQSETAAGKPGTDNVNGMLLSKDPLLFIDPRSTRSWSSLPSESPNGNGGLQQHHSGGEWGDMLDIISRRKTETLAPEHFENMWTKGRNYRKKEGECRLTDPAPRNSSAGISKTMDQTRHKEKYGATKGSSLESSAPLSGCNVRAAADNLLRHSDRNISSYPPVISEEDDDEHNNMHLDEVESGSSSGYTTEDDENSSVTGLDSPGVKVWDGKNNRNVSVSHIHHPLEISEGRKTRKTHKGHANSQHLAITESGRKRSRLSSQEVHVWQEIRRTSFLSGDGQDILKSSKANVKSDTSDESETEMLGRIRSGATASPSVSSVSTPESHGLAANPPKHSFLADTFLKLRCEVLGANIVKSGSKTFAVYSISVTDVNNNSWSIKRRFRHFEELHRRLKEFPEYNLHLPPKHFLSTGLDVLLIQERCKLLDTYLKKLLQLPTISGSIEVWDFLSVDSQTYVFSNSLSIIETLSDDTGHEKSEDAGNIIRPAIDLLSSRRGQMNAEGKKSASQMKHDCVADVSRLNKNGATLSPPKRIAKEYRRPFEDSSSDSDNVVQKNIFPTKNSGKTTKGGDSDDLHGSPELLMDAAADPALPSEWVPPNLSVPILDLVDVIFQLQDGGWIRRKAFWVAKQALQLGMGDAFDDWLIEKIQLLRRGSVVASGIRRVEQILWPDGIFITKHPKRQRPTPSANPSPHSSARVLPPPTPSSTKIEDIQKLDEITQKEAERRAKFVYELMIDNAPAAIVSLFGRKEYEQCAKDLYYFLQVTWLAFFFESPIRNS